MLRSLATYRVVQEDDRPGEMPRPLMLCGLVYSFLLYWTSFVLNGTLDLTFFLVSIFNYRNQSVMWILNTHTHTHTHTHTQQSPRSQRRSRTSLCSERVPWESKCIFMSSKVCFCHLCTAQHDWHWNCFNFTFVSHAHIEHSNIETQISHEWPYMQQKQTRSLTNSFPALLPSYATITPCSVYTVTSTHPEKQQLCQETLLRSFVSPVFASYKQLEITAKYIANNHKI